MSESELYKRAEKRVDEKIGFYRHLYSFIGGNVVLIITNVVTNITSGETSWWFYWVTVFWGIGLLSHFLKVFVFSAKLDDNREKMIENEMRKMKK